MRSHMACKQCSELQNVKQEIHYFIPASNNRPKQPAPGMISKTVSVHARKQSRGFSLPATAFVSFLSRGVAVNNGSTQQTPSEDPDATTPTIWPWTLVKTIHGIC